MACNFTSTLNDKSLKAAAKPDFGYFENILPYLFSCKIPFLEAQFLFYEHQLKTTPFLTNNALKRKLINNFFPILMAIFNDIKECCAFDKAFMHRLCVDHIEPGTIFELVRLNLQKQ